MWLVTALSMSCAQQAETGDSSVSQMSHYFLKGRSLMHLCHLIMPCATALITAAVIQKFVAWD